MILIECSWEKEQPVREFAGIALKFQAVPFINFGLLIGEHPLVTTTLSSRSILFSKKKI